MCINSGIKLPEMKCISRTVGSYSCLIYSTEHNWELFYNSSYFGGFTTNNFQVVSTSDIPHSRESYFPSWFMGPTLAQDQFNVASFVYAILYREHMRSIQSATPGSHNPFLADKVVFNLPKERRRRKHKKSPPLSDAASALVDWTHPSVFDDTWSTTTSSGSCIRQPTPKSDFPEGIAFCNSGSIEPQSGIKQDQCPTSSDVSTSPVKEKGVGKVDKNDRRMFYEYSLGNFTCIVWAMKSKFEKMYRQKSLKDLYLEDFVIIPTSLCPEIGRNYYVPDHFKRKDDRDSLLVERLLDSYLYAILLREACSGEIRGTLTQVNNLKATTDKGSQFSSNTKKVKLSGDTKDERSPSEKEELKRESKQPTVRYPIRAGPNGDLRIFPADLTNSNIIGTDMQVWRTLSFDQKHAKISKIFNQVRNACAVEPGSQSAIMYSALTGAPHPNILSSYDSRKQISASTMFQGKTSNTNDFDEAAAFA